jgi:DNA-binding transcriptional regulator YiaG
MLGVNPQHVTGWKKGRNRPSAETALAMLELIKTKPKN